jgi:hypothetical protein
VNYVLSDNKITKMVEPDNVAWTSQNGNATTISIEHQPTLGDEGYRKSGWLVCELEKKYGRRLTLYPHKHWFNTACPGTIDLNRIRAEADKWHNGGEDMAVIPDQDNWYWRFRKLMQQVRGRDMDRAEFQKNFVGTDSFRMVEILPALPPFQPKGFY